MPDNEGKSSKSSSPINVTLEKSATGTWSAPSPRMHKLKPWQRLWVVSGIIYMLALAGSYYMLMPNQERIERKLVLAVTEEVKRFEGMAFAGESPRKIFEAARSQGYTEWITATRTKFRIGPEGNAGFDRIDKEYREAISDLPMKRIIGILICIVAWVMPMALFYAFGLVVDWIRRGVRDVQKSFTQE